MRPDGLHGTSCARVAGRSRGFAHDSKGQDGALQIGAARYENLVPRPFPETGPAVLAFSGGEGRLRARGESARLFLLDAARYEAFEP